MANRQLAYRTIWRWHFYAGLFCIPFVLWLSATGSLYLFKPQIEAWLDRPFDSLEPGPPASGVEQVRAAIGAVPGSTFVAYELPHAPTAAARVMVGEGRALHRVYVNPSTAEVLGVVDEDARLMRRVFYLHGELMMGRFGSTIVELAASWAVVMILSGLFLWWPRGSTAAGVFYPRLRSGGRVFWRDVHAVTGVWVSLFALVLIFSGLPWAKNWGAYLQKVRAATGSVAAERRWTTSRAEELADREATTTAMAAAATEQNTPDTGTIGTPRPRTPALTPLSTE